MMWKGTLLQICVAPGAAEPMRCVEQARAVPGRGLNGDRYAEGAGTWSGHTPPLDNEITLIEVEAVEAVAHESGITLQARDARRNLVTRSVPLNHLVGREFCVGEVRLRGIRLCEPCAYLEGMTSPGLKVALAHRGGLRAEILSEGVLRPGDEISETI